MNDRISKDDKNCAKSCVVDWRESKVDRISGKLQHEAENGLCSVVEDSAKEK